MANHGCSWAPMGKGSRPDLAIAGSRDQSFVDLLGCGWVVDAGAQGRANASRLAPGRSVVGCLSEGGVVGGLYIHCSGSGCEGSGRWVVGSMKIVDTFFSRTETGSSPKG